MFRALTVCLALAGGIAFAAPASAIVSYTLTGNGSSFIYYAPSFLSANVTEDTGALAECSFNGGACETVGFYPDARGLGFTNDTTDVITFTYANNNGTSYTYFQNNVLQHPGTYQDTYLGLTPSSTLVVADVHRPTPGTVTYNLHTTGLDITLQTNAYIDGSNTVAAGNLVDCVFPGHTCDDVRYYGDPQAAGSPTSEGAAIVVDYDNNASSFFYFGDDTLSVPGVYGETNGFGAILTLSAVPEPAAWLLMIVGVSVVGARRASGVERRGGASCLPEFNLRPGSTRGHKAANGGNRT